MTKMILPVSNTLTPSKQQTTERMQVAVHIQAEVLTADAARRHANVWLTMNAGHLLQVRNPELILADTLQWRLDVFLSLPQNDYPGKVAQRRIGQVYLDATTGEVAEPLALIEELTTNADALVAG